MRVGSEPSSPELLPGLPTTQARRIEPTTLLHDLVRDRPGAIAVLDAHRIDWCCGARRTLADACAKAGVTLPVVLDALHRDTDASTTKGDGPSFAELGALPVSEIVDEVLTRHHAYTRAEAPRLGALATKVATRHGADHPELIALEALVHELFAELDEHMSKEEQVLFPRVRAEALAPSGSLAPPIEAMMAEHVDAGRLLDEIVRVTDGFRVPAGACGSWSALLHGLRAHDADLRRHVFTENELLFPMALALSQRGAP